MKKFNKIFLILSILVVLLFTLIYFILLNNGKYVFNVRTKQVNTMMEYYPTFFEKIFNEIFPTALKCDRESNCISNVRRQIDKLSSSVVEKEIPIEDKNDLFLGNNWEFKPSNQQPMYFISLLPDGHIAKLFFSGGIIIEEIDTKGEGMVVQLLEGKRIALYGPYFNQEVFEAGWHNPQNRPFYDLKPSYLKDLYSQMEVIVPYKVNGVTRGAVVYLHGE